VSAKSRVCRAIHAILLWPGIIVILRAEWINISSSNGYKAENERACTMREWDEKCKHFGWKTPRKKTIWRLHTDGRIMLKFILQK
jgi:hypothetical protein